MESNIKANTINTIMTIDCIYELIENGSYTESTQYEIVTAICNDNITRDANPGHNWILRSLRDILNGTLDNNDKYLYYKACRITGFVASIINKFHPQRIPLVISEYIINGILIPNMLHNSIFAIEEMVLWTISQIILLYNKTQIQANIKPLLLIKNHEKSSFVSKIIQHFQHNSEKCDFHLEDIYSTSSTYILWTLLSSKNDDATIWTLLFEKGINQILYGRLQNLHLYLSENHRLPSIGQHYYRINLTLLIRTFMARIKLTKTTFKQNINISEHDILTINNILANFKFIRSNTIDFKYMHEIGMSEQLITTIAQFANIILTRMINIRCCNSIKSICTQHPIFQLSLPEQVNNNTIIISSSMSFIYLNVFICFLCTD